MSKITKVYIPTVRIPVKVESITIVIDNIDPSIPEGIIVIRDGR
jgi:hypothetical protein